MARLTSQVEELEGRARLDDEREQELEARIAAVTQRELAVAQSAAALAGRERELADAAAAVAVAEAARIEEPSEPAPALSFRAGGSPTLPELERLVDQSAAQLTGDRVEELRTYSRLPSRLRRCGRRSAVLVRRPGRGGLRRADPGPLMRPLTLCSTRSRRVESPALRDAAALRAPDPAPARLRLPGPAPRHVRRRLSQHRERTPAPGAARGAGDHLRLHAGSRRAAPDSRAGGGGCVRGRTETMDSDDLRGWAERGVAIGSHTVSHPHLPELDEDDLRRELVESRSGSRRSWAGRASTCAYPYGHEDTRVQAAAAAAGYGSPTRCPGTKRIGIRSPCRASGSTPRRARPVRRQGERARAPARGRVPAHDGRRT